jgi:hypothetical protein
VAKNLGGSRSNASTTIDLTDKWGLGMKRAVVVSYFPMISLGAFLLILCGVLGSVVWACVEDQNEI